MASIIITNLEDRLEQELRARAARHGTSVEEEARQILQAALEAEREPARGFFSAIRRRIDPVKGVNLKIPRRRSIRKPLRFDE